MTQDEYETIIGKLVLTKLYMTQKYRVMVDEIIEALEDAYLEKKMKGDL